MKRIFVAEPELGGNEKKYVLDCLETTWISSQGKYIAAFEKSFADFCGSKHAISTNNGTTALHLALVALGVGAGDEVIVPTVTYVSTANAVKYCNATPVLVDVSPGTLNLNPSELEARITKRTRGIIAVHLYGHPADMKAINDIASQNNLFVIEDAAEAHGAQCCGKIVGSLSTCAAFSFYGNKIVTTGEGGMLTTDDDELNQRIRSFRGQGMDVNRRYWFPVVGYNYRMTNVQAAIGLAQMERVEQSLLKRSQVAKWYDEDLADLQDKIRLPFQDKGTRHAFWMYTVFLKDAGHELRQDVMTFLESQNIETRPVFYPLHWMPPYKQEIQFPVADIWAARGINLPTHQCLTRQDVRRIATALKEALSIFMPVINLS